MFKVAEVVFLFFLETFVGHLGADELPYKLTDTPIDKSPGKSIIPVTTSE